VPGGHTVRRTVGGSVVHDDDVRPLGQRCQVVERAEQGGDPVARHDRDRQPVGLERPDSSEHTSG
jgi:hypothetical protein